MSLLPNQKIIYALIFSVLLLPVNYVFAVNESYSDDIIQWQIKHNEILDKIKSKSATNACLFSIQFSQMLNDLYIIERKHDSKRFDYDEIYSILIFTGHYQITFCSSVEYQNQHDMMQLYLRTYEYLIHMLRVSGIIIIPDEFAEYKYGGIPEFTKDTINSGVNNRSESE